MRSIASMMAAFTLALAGCSADSPAPRSASASASKAEHPEARLYDASSNAKADVDAALLRAEENGKLVLIALGANWCHDSRAFAGWLEMPRFKDLVERKYELVYVNVGMPQTKDGHNLDIAERFGIEVQGTPTVLVVSPIGEVLNADTAGSWRNAASRSADAIFDELDGFPSAQTTG